MADNHYYQATVMQTVIVVAPDAEEAGRLIQRHLPGRSIYGISAGYGRFEVNGTASGLEIVKIVPLTLEQAASHLTRSQEIERQLRAARGGQQTNVRK